MQDKFSFDSYGDLSSPYLIRMPLYSEVPCGQCSGCRMDRSREWANRMLMELQYHTSAWFLTLTYDDDHLQTILRSCRPPDTDEDFPVLSLCPEDLQLFLKKLRVYQDRRHHDSPKIRFYAAGEYGDHTFRPHYHLIVYDLILDSSELEFYKQSEHGFNYYKCEWLTNLWKNGFIVVAPVSWATCAYVARYCTKKLTGDASKFYEIFNLEPPFSRASRRPGLGAQFFKDHASEIYHYDRIYVSGEDRGYEFNPPRYFDKLYELSDPESLASLKRCRKHHAEAQDEWYQVFTEYDKLDRLEIEETAFNARISTLVRNLD